MQVMMAQLSFGKQLDLFEYKVNHGLTKQVCRPLTAESAFGSVRTRRALQPRGKAHF